MGKTEESPAPLDGLHPTRHTKKRKKAELRFCRGAEVTPEVLPRTPNLLNPTFPSPPEPTAKLFAGGEGICIEGKVGEGICIEGKVLALQKNSLDLIKKEIADPEIKQERLDSSRPSTSSRSSSRSSSRPLTPFPFTSSRISTSSRAPPPPPPANVDLHFLLDCDAISSQFLFPHFSFHDLRTLEMTSKSIKKIVWSKHVWRQKVEELRAKDKNADVLMSRYKSNLSPFNPEYYKRLIAKYLKDSHKIYGNVRAGSWRASHLTFDIATTCHRAFAIHESGKFAFIQDLNDVVVLSLELNKSGRGYNLERKKQFPIIQPDDFCSLLACHGDLVFHATYKQLYAWDWKQSNEHYPKRLQIRNQEKIDVTGLGLVRALFIQDNCLVIGSNDGGEAHPTTGKALVQLWRLGDITGDEMKMKIIDQKTELPVKNPVWDAFQDTLAEYKPRRPTSVALHGDGHLIAIGFCFNFCCKTDSFDQLQLGKVRFYNHKTEQWVSECYFDGGASCIKVNASLGKAVVGFDKWCYDSKAYVKVIDVNTCQTLKNIMSSETEINCLWTDWKRFIFTGSHSCLLMWEMIFGVDDAGSKSRFCLDEEFVTGYGGKTRMPMFDNKIYDIAFDGFNIIVYTRGSQRATVRLFDCLKLTSLKF